MTARRPRGPADLAAALAALEPPRPYARDWLDALPGRAAAAARRLRIDLDGVLAVGWEGVAFTESAADGREVVLKLADRPLDRAAAAYRHFSGRGTAALVAYDAAACALVTVRVRPGTPLDLPDDRLPALLRRLHRRPDRAGAAAFDTLVGYYGPRLARRAEELASLPAPYAPPLPARLVLAARDDLAALAETAPAGEHVVLHGDLTPRNILAGRGGEPVVIDPIGRIGERGWDLARHLWARHRGERAWDGADALARDMGVDAPRLRRLLRVQATGETAFRVAAQARAREEPGPVVTAEAALVRRLWA